MTKTPDFTHATYRLVRCIGCDATVSVCRPQEGEYAQCPRCHHKLQSGSHWSLKRCSLIALSILILMPFALGYPLLSLDLLGTKIDASVWKGIWKMAVEGYSYTAFMIFICAVLMPVSFAILVIMLQLSKLLKIKPRNVLLFVGYIKPWVMFDVYLVALGVTMFKVREYATLEVDVYLIAFVFTALLTTLLFIKINLDDLWHDFYPDQKPVTKSDKPLELCTACDYTFLKEDQECMLVVSGDKHAYISKSFADKKDFISLFMKNVQFVESYDDIEDDILKFSIASFDDQMEQRIEKIQKQLKPHLKLVTTGNVWFDIFYKDVNKGTTLTHLLEILKIKPEESGAFGDQMNDYEMLQTVKYGYAMANAMPPVKEVAYQVIDSNENDGVILKIKEILKGNY